MDYEWRSQHAFSDPDGQYTRSATILPSHQHSHGFSRYSTYGPANAFPQTSTRHSTSSFPHRDRATPGPETPQAPPERSSRTNGKAYYTTVGSVYKPDSVIPLQPPVRRVRSSRWNVGSAGLDPRLIVDNSTYQRACDLPSPLTPSDYHAPLQQNLDRAAKPRKAWLNNEWSHLQDKIQETILTGHDNGYHLPLSPDSSMEDGKTATDEWDNEVDDDKMMELVRHYNTQSLQSLTKFPNRFRKHAMRALEQGRARVVSTVDNGEHKEDKEAFVIPTTHKAFQDRSNDINGTETSNTIAILGSFIPHTSENSTRRLTSWHSGVKGQEPIQRDLKVLMHRTSSAKTSKPSDRNDIPTVSAYSRAGTLTSLASGPGAPQPLSAGPPGARRHQPTSFDSSSTSAMTSDLAACARGGSGARGEVVPTAILQRQDIDRHGRRSVQVRQPVCTSGPGPWATKIRPQATDDKPPVIHETLPLERAREYFGGLVPSNWNAADCPPFNGEDDVALWNQQLDPELRECYSRYYSDEVEKWMTGCKHHSLENGHTDGSRPGDQAVNFHNAVGLDEFCLSFGDHVPDCIDSSPFKKRAKEESPAQLNPESHPFQFKGVSEAKSTDYGPIAPPARK